MSDRFGDKPRAKPEDWYQGPIAGGPAGGGGGGRSSGGCALDVIAFVCAVLTGLAIAALM